MELGAATLFARFLLSEPALVETVVSPGDPVVREPDALLHVGIEVTQVYYSDDDAHELADLLHDLDRGIRRTTGIREVPSADLTFVERAQFLLDHKATRSYSLPTYLVLDARVAPLHSSDEGPRIAGQLHVPASAPFLAVYLLLAHNGRPGVAFFRIGEGPHPQ